MQLKQAFEAVTEHIDVRPGFVGDVMTGARRRRTRKLLIVTAVVALLAGGVAGALLTRPHERELTSADQRFGQPTHGNLANDTAFLDKALAKWHAERTTPRSTIESSGRTHVYWAGTTPAGPAAVLMQPVKVPSEPNTVIAIGVVAGDEFVGAELDCCTPGEQGLFRFGLDNTTYLVLARGLPVYYSMRVTRNNDDRLSREWHELPIPDGVAVVTTQTSDNPVFVAQKTPPAADDFKINDVLRAVDKTSRQAFRPHPGLGWDGRRLATDQPKFLPDVKAPFGVWQELRAQALVDYSSGTDSFSSWHVVAALPDGRTALVFEIDSRVVAGLYGADSALERVVVGDSVVKDRALPVRITVPNGQGVVVADYGARLGPDERPDAWLAPAGTTEVTVKRGDQVQVVPL